MDVAAVGLCARYGSRRFVSVAFASLMELVGWMDLVGLVGLVGSDTGDAAVFNSGAWLPSLVATSPLWA